MWDQAFGSSEMSVAFLIENSEQVCTLLSGRIIEYILEFQTSLISDLLMCLLKPRWF